MKRATMSDKNKTTISFGGFGLGTLLTIVFLVLKLCGVIDWAWIFVFLPIIISVGFTILVWAVIFIIAIVLYYKDWWGQSHQFLLVVWSRLPFLAKTFQKSIDFSKKVWYNKCTKSVRETSSYDYQNLKKVFQNPLTNSKKYGIIYLFLTENEKNFL